MVVSMLPDESDTSTWAVNVNDEVLQMHGTTLLGVNLAGEETLALRKFAILGLNQTNQSGPHVCLWLPHTVFIRWMNETNFL